MSNQIDSENEFDKLCRAIGCIVVFWAISEQGLDQWVAIIYHHCGGNKLDNEIPRSLKKKVDFLDRSFKQLPILSNFKDEGLNLLKDVSRLSKDRHDFVHGAIKGEPSESGVFHFAKIDYEKQIHRLRNVKLDGPKFRELSKELPDLAMTIALFSSRLLNHLGLSAQ